MRAIGRVSYGLYLWHLPVFLVVQAQTAGWPAPRQVALALSLTTALTLFSWYAVEKPCLRLKRRLEPRSAVAPAPRLVLGPQAR